MNTFISSNKYRFNYNNDFSGPIHIHIPEYDQTICISTRALLEFALYFLNCKFDSIFDDIENNVDNPFEEKPKYISTLNEEYEGYM